MAGQAHAQSYTGVITLDPIPAEIRTGSTVTFSGQLATASGYVVPGATVYIKDDVDFGRDAFIRTLVTDGSGRFTGTWTAQPRSSGAWDFYAVYEGGPEVSRDRSATYEVRVSSSYYGPNPAGGTGPGSTDYRTSITLDRIPASTYAGDSVTFTGKLTSGGQPLRDALVKIYEDDPLSPDQRLGSGRTDSEGGFSITWRVGAGLVETDFDIYAVFDGDAIYKRDRTPNQVMSVLKHGGSITLDPLPASASVGDVVVFSGTLRLDGASPEGAVVYIKDEDPLSGDDLLATAYVERSGRFSTSWFADYADPGRGDVDIYAVFEGNDEFYRLTTCDVGPTMSVGGSCPHTIPLAIYGSAPTAPPSGYVRIGSEYMELYYSLDFHRSPHVAIIPDPDSYEDVRGHITPVKEGILMWQSYMEHAYGGDWDVTFEVIEPGKPFFYGSKPDVLVNLDTYDRHAQCYADYFGSAKISPNPRKPVQTTVCSTYGEQRRSNADVAATAAHEFIHAVGLGHTFNKRGDMMCSVEDDKPTCDGLNSKLRRPSGLNLAAVAEMYGTDGFRSPNGHVTYKERFSAEAGDPYSGGAYAPPPSNYVPPEPAPTNTACPRGDYAYDQDVSESLKPGWYIKYTICSHGPISYVFSTDSKYDGFEIYLLPPETDVEKFISDGEGSYYVCEEYGEIWHVKPNTCSIESGSNIVLYNPMDNTIRIDGYVGSHA